MHSNNNHNYGILRAHITPIRKWADLELNEDLWIFSPASTPLTPSAQNDRFLTKVGFCQTPLHRFLYFCSLPMSCHSIYLTSTMLNLIFSWHFCNVSGRWAEDGIRTRDFNLGEVALCHWVTSALKMHSCFPLAEDALQSFSVSHGASTQYCLMWCTRRSGVKILAYLK